MKTETTNKRVGRALAEAKERYRQANPKSLAQHERAAEVMPGGNTRTVIFTDPFPLTLVTGKDARVRSLDGHWYRDFLGEYTAGFYGHSDPRLKEAVLEALERGWSMGGHTEVEAEMASLINDRFPSMELMRFANSGTEANLYAISAARAVTGRKKVVVFEGGYHGGVFVFSAGARHPLTAPFDFVVAPYNDVGATSALLEAAAPDIAAVIVEQMQGSGGCIPADRAFLEFLRDWTRRNGAVLIFDEVMTSRLSYGGLQSIHDIAPDMTTLGKYLGGGFSFGAFGGSAEIMKRFDPRQPHAITHAGTFNNNIFTMTAGVAGMKFILTQAVIHEVNARGDRLRERLNAIASRAAFPMQFTGRGSMMNVHMTRNDVKSVRDLKDADLALRDLFYFDLLAQGFWIAKRGMVNLAVPTTDADCDALADAIESFVSDRSNLGLD
jgi:glutamate-1-semialdehyde 2,1-aminomutase